MRDNYEISEERGDSCSVSRKPSFEVSLIETTEKNETELVSPADSMARESLTSKNLDNLGEELPLLLKEMNETAANAIEGSELDTAVDCLQKSEQLLEMITTQGRDVDRNLIIVTMYNCACAFQRQGKMEKCVNYLDAAIFNIEKKVTNFQQVDMDLSLTKKLSEQEKTSQVTYKQISLASKMMKLRFQTKMHLQLCAALSQINEHNKALKQARLAVKFCHDLLLYTSILCKKLKQSVSESKVNTLSTTRDIITKSGNVEKVINITTLSDHRTEMEQDGNEFFNKMHTFSVKNTEENSLQGTGKMNMVNTNNTITPSLDMQKTLSTSMEYDMKSLYDPRSIFYFEERVSIMKNLVSQYEPILEEIILQIKNFSGFMDKKYNLEERGVSVNGVNDILSNPLNFLLEGGLRGVKNEEKIRATNITNIVTSESICSNYERGDSFGNPLGFSNSLHEERVPQLKTWDARSVKEELLEEKEGGYRKQTLTLSRIEELKKWDKYKIKVRTMLGKKCKEDWIYNVNIGNVMHLFPLSLDELAIHADTTHEISRDAMFEKIILLAVSYFCLGTELRFLGLQDDTLTNYKKQCEAWQGKALEIVCTFLPKDCPLVSHITTSYQRHHALSEQVIQEDELREEEESELELERTEDHNPKSMTAGGISDTFNKFVINSPLTEPSESTPILPHSISGGAITIGSSGRPSSPIFSQNTSNYKMKPSLPQNPPHRFLSKTPELGIFHISSMRGNQRNNVKIEKQSLQSWSFKPKYPHKQRKKSHFNLKKGVEEKTRVKSKPPSFVLNSKTGVKNEDIELSLSNRGGTMSNYSGRPRRPLSSTKCNNKKEKSLEVMPGIILKSARDLGMYKNIKERICKGEGEGEGMEHTGKRGYIGGQVGHMGETEKMTRRLKVSTSTPKLHTTSELSNMYKVNSSIGNKHLDILRGGGEHKGGGLWRGSNRQGPGTGTSAHGTGTSAHSTTSLIAAGQHLPPTISNLRPNSKNRITNTAKLLATYSDRPSNIINTGVRVGVGVLHSTKSPHTQTFSHNNSTPKKLSSPHHRGNIDTGIRVDNISVVNHLNFYSPTDWAIRQRALNSLTPHSTPFSPKGEENIIHKGMNNMGTNAYYHKKK